MKRSIIILLSTSTLLVVMSVVAMLAWLSHLKHLDDRLHQVGSEMVLLRGAILSFNENKRPLFNSLTVTPEYKVLPESIVMDIIRQIGFGENRTIVDIEEHLTLLNNLPLDPWGKPFQVEVRTILETSALEKAPAISIRITSVGSGLSITLPERHANP